MADAEQRNILVRTDIKVSGFLAFCSDPSITYGRGKQLMRGIARGTQPTVVMVWVIIWILATRDPTMHERLVNMFVGTVLGYWMCIILKLIFKRPRPPIVGGTPGKGVGQYSFPSDHIMICMLAYYIVTSGYKGSSEMMMVMKLGILIICVTKIMLGRIYIFDILAGMLLGMILYQILIRFLWISSAKCEPYIKSAQAALHLYH